MMRRVLLTRCFEPWLIYRTIVFEILVIPTPVGVANTRPVEIQNGSNMSQKKFPAAEVFWWCNFHCSPSCKYSSSGGKILVTWQN